ncbi:MAG TPA: hypothetical protein VGM30_04645 [Puia sp.]
MKTLKSASFLLLMGTIGMGTLRAQTADEIVSKHEEALGGKAVVMGLKSLYTESTVEVNGQEATSNTTILNGKGFKSEADFGGTKMIQVVTPTSGWAVSPMMGQPTPVALTDQQLKIGQAQIHIGDALVDYAAKGYKVELIGKDTTGGVTDFKLRLTGSGLEATYYINGKTWLLDKEIDHVSANGQEIETTISYADYKKTDAGFVMYGSRSITLPQYTVNFTNKKIEVNKDVDPKIFDMPK